MPLGTDVDRPRPDRPRSAHYRLPVRSPVRWLFMASACGICAFVEILAWSALRLPLFFLQGGIILLVVGALLTVAALVFRRRAGWALSLSPTQLTVLRGTRSTAWPWSEITGAEVVKSWVVIRGRSAAPVARLLFDTRAAAAPLLAELIEAIDRRSAARQEQPDPVPPVR